MTQYTYGHQPAHSGKRTTADPVTTLTDLEKVKNLLRGHTRNYALWVLATNTMLRAGDLVALQWTDLHEENGTITIRTLMQKTGKPITIPLSQEVSTALRAWRAECESPFIFSGQRGQLTVSFWSRLVKDWCHQVGLKGNFSSHTTRKTGARLRHDFFDVELSTLMHMLGHTSERTTLIYLGKMDQRVQHAFSVSL